MSSPAAELKDDARSSSTSRTYDMLGRRFREALNSATSHPSRPCLQEFLADVPQQDRSFVLRNLLQVEIDYRRGNGEKPTVEEYTSLFPDAAPVIRALFQRSDHVTEERMTVDYQSRHPELYAGKTPLESFDKNYLDGDDETLPVIPGYEVLTKLGKGGMGVVYKARHLLLDRLVALKMILPLYDPSERRFKRFLAEAAIVARFHHANVVQIYEIGQAHGHPYFSLELVEGGNLSQRLASAPMGAEPAALMVETLARAIQYAHEKGVVHRDLKPSNILLSTTGELKVADFGLAKEMGEDPEATEEGGMIGTPAYMSPEQAWGRNDEVGPAADIHALGVILYEALTGRPPYRAVSKVQTLELVRKQDPVPPRNLVPRIPRDLELVCLKCLAKEPAKRFATALELADELRRFQEHRPIQTRPNPVWERAWKWTRRQPTLALLMAVSVLAILGFVLFLDQRARWAERELREEVRTRAIALKVQALHQQAKDETDRGELQQARGSLQAALAIAHPEPSLGPYLPMLVGLEKDLDRKEADRNEQLDARNRLAKFDRLRDETLFRGMVFAGLDLNTNVAVTIAGASSALELLQLKLDSSEGPTISRYYSEAEKRRVTIAAYELLLVWAEAEAQPEPGNATAERAKLQKSLELLDRAQRLPVAATRAYHLRRARYLELLGDQESAASARLQADATEPAGALDFFLMGELNQKQRRLGEAAGDFAQALQIEPGHFWARYFLAICDLQLQRPAQARDHLTACMISRGDFVWLYLLRGFANGQLNHYAAAEKDYLRALDLDPDAQAKYGILVNQAMLGLRHVRQLQTAVPTRLLLGSGLERAIWLGAEWQCQKALETTESLLTRAAQMMPDQYAAYRSLGMLDQQRRQWDKALAWTTRALESNQAPDRLIQATLFSQRARIHRERHDYDAALLDLNSALEAYARAEDFVQRGYLEFTRKEYRQALASFDAALRLGPQETDWYRWRAETLQALNRDAEAGRAWDDLIERLAEPDAAAYRARALVRTRLQQFPGALADFTRALHLQPNSSTFTGRGWVFLANDASSLALQDFEEAIRLDPRNAEAYTGRGLIRVRMKQLELALADAENSLTVASQPSPRLLWNTAHVYAQLFAADKAKTSFGPLARDRFQDKAIELLRGALERIPAEGRAAFWKKYLARDGLLDPIRGSLKFERLTREYSAPSE